MKWINTGDATIEAGGTLELNGATVMVNGTEVTNTVVDDTLSDTSENPVQNKAIKAALEGKQDTLTAGDNITISDDGTISAENTTYGTATTSAAGLMSAADKEKLDGIAAGAEVNQAAFQEVEVADGDTKTTIAATEKEDSLSLVAGDGITLAADAANGAVTIGMSAPLLILTQEEYDALTTKDENTVYFIKG